MYNSFRIRSHPAWLIDCVQRVFVLEILSLYYLGGGGGGGQQGRMWGEGICEGWREEMC